MSASASSSRANAVDSQTATHAPAPKSIGRVRGGRAWRGRERHIPAGIADRRARRAAAAGASDGIALASAPGSLMRILELHAPYFRAHWRRTHEVLAWGQHAHCDLVAPGPVARLADVLRRLPWVPDVIVFGDDSRFLQVLGLEDAPCPVAVISVDAHHHAGWQAPLAAACDATLVAQCDHLADFEAAGAPRIAWMPVWAPDDVPPPAAEKAYDVSFVGTLDPRLNPDRVALVDALRTRLPLHVGSGDWRPVFARSRIVLNQTVKGDLNFRVVEAMASGALLLTERTGNGLLRLFGDGEELVTYPRGDVDAIVAAAGRWLADERGRAAIAERGRAAVLARHCESRRAAEVLAHLAGPHPARPRTLRLAAAGRAYGMLAFFAGKLARTWPDARFGLLREAYLAAAGAIAARPDLPDVERRALVGLLDLERGEPRRALEHLEWVAGHGGRPEDHVLLVEALVRLGDLARARTAALRLRAAFPAFELGRTLVEGLAA
jgi:glycosyltransferase involved in cell wall biosynthesis